MKYFNGFSLQGEEAYFSDYLLQGDENAAGFSYGAQQAFEYVYQSQKRIDRLVLLSPAFFQTQKPSFKRTQLRYFEAGKEAYAEQFLKNAAFPSSADLSKNLSLGTKEELDALLSYKWEAEKIKKVLQKGTVIEVFLGEEDKIIVPGEALSFFEALVPVYTLCSRGHLLQP